MKPRMSTARVACSALLVSLLLAACGGDKPEALLASAKDYLAKHDNKAAVIQIKNALQQDPNSAEARFLLGSALLANRDPASAEVEFRKALELKYAADAVVPLLVRSLVEQNKAKKATDEFAASSLTDPAAKADLALALAQAYGNQNDMARAQAALQAAVQANPGYPPALIAQARQKASLRDYAGAQALVDEVLAKQATNADALKLKGDILLYGRADANGALDAYRKAVEVQPGYVAGYYGLVAVLISQNNYDEAAKALEQLKKVNGGVALARFFETQIAYRKKDFKQARVLAQELLKSAPDNPKVLELAGAIEFQLNSMLQAESYLRKALQQSPDLSLARRTLATLYLLSGQTDKALALMPADMDKDAKDPELMALAGQAYLQSGDVRKAEDYFSKASKLDPKDARQRTSLALTHMVGGKTDAAFGELEDIAASDSGATADMALISARLRRKEYDKALKAIDGLEKKQPDSPVPAHLRGVVLLSKQDVTSARKQFEAALAKNATYLPSVNMLVRLDLAEQKNDQALGRFDAVLSKDPKSVGAMLGRAELRERLGGKPDEVADLLGKAIAANPTEPQPRQKLIELYLRNKDYKQALSAAQSAVSALPANAELQDALGRVFQASGDTNQAVAAYNKLATLQPGSAVPHLRLAGAYMAAKNLDAAAQSLRKALEITPDQIDAQRGLVGLYVQQKKFDEARQVALTAQKQQPKAPAGFLMEGDVYSAQQKWGEATEAYRNGLKVSPLPELAVKLHATLQYAGKAAEADRFATGWMKDHPKDVAFSFHMGDASIARRDFAGAEKYYQTVIQLQPTNAMAFNNLAWVTGQLKKDGAIRLAEKANQLTPNQTVFMDTLAVLLSEAKQHERAIELEKKALDSQPKNSVLRLNLAQIYINAGDKKKAKEILDDLASQGDKFTAQAEVARLLKSL